MNKKTIYIIVAVLVVVIVVASAGVLLMQPNNGGNTPSEGPDVNFQVGAWVNYTSTSYDNDGNVAGVMPMQWSVEEGAYNGSNCWILNQTMWITADGSMTETLIVWYVDKTSFNNLHMTMMTYVDGVLMSTDEYNPDSPGFISKPAMLNEQTGVGQETITVPAGTFNCNKSTTTDATTGTVTNIWYNSDIPVFSLVKEETLNGTQVTSLTELTAYGN